MLLSTTPVPRGTSVRSAYSGGRWRSKMNENLRPVIAPSDVERNACELMSTISTDGCEEKAKAAKLKATLSTLTSESIPAPIFLARANAAECEKLAEEIDALRKAETA